MKKKEKYKIINSAKKQYSKDFKLNLEYKYLSKKKLLELLKQNKYSAMCEWSYCCFGLYTNCWQEPFEDGVNGLNQKQVTETIKHVINYTAKACKRDNRILYCEANNQICVFIIARDIYESDFLITFSNEK